MMKRIINVALLAFSPLLFIQCTRQNILELDYVTRNATECCVYITEQSDTTTITIKNVKLVWNENHDDMESVLEYIR